MAIQDPAHATLDRLQKLKFGFILERPERNPSLLFCNFMSHFPVLSMEYPVYIQLEITAMIGTRGTYLLTDLKSLENLIKYGTSHIKEVGSDIMIFKYHDTLMQRYLFFYRDDNSLDSDTMVLDLTTSPENISSIDSEIPILICQTPRKQSSVDTNQKDKNTLSSRNSFPNLPGSAWNSECSDFRSSPLSDGGIEKFIPTNGLLSRRLSKPYIDDG